jgi:hypothetical protein
MFRTIRDGSTFGFAITTVFDPIDDIMRAVQFGLTGVFDPMYPAIAVVTVIDTLDINTSTRCVVTLVSAIGVKASNYCDLCGGRCILDDITIGDDALLRDLFGNGARFRGGQDGIHDTEPTGFNLGSLWRRARDYVKTNW